MITVNLKSLVEKLNDECREALEAAAGLTLSRTHYNVEIEHWLFKLIESTDNDINAIARHYGVDLSRLNRDLMRILDSFKTGNSRAPALSPNLVNLAKETWLLSSLEYGATRSRSGHLLCAMLADDGFHRIARDLSTELERIPVDELRENLVALTKNSKEVVTYQEDTDVGEKTATPASGKALDQFTLDLTAAARDGTIDPVLGRDSEIRQVIDILTRRRQNNPILTGEAGVGKTAVVEGFAQRVADGDVPPALRDISIRTLDLALLQAGAGIKGEFENRLKSVINEVKSSPQPIIMFIDEAHTLIGAGGQAGQGDAANLLKPALARGELRTIAATTWAEYKKYFEQDAALTRRFQVVKVEEPDEDTACAMMRGLVATLEDHHKVRILDEAVNDAVKLSHRYIPARQLPDKAISLLDTTCARVAIGNSTVPPAVEDCRRQVEQLDTNIRILERELVAGAEHTQSLSELEKQKKEVQDKLAELEQRWKQESELVNTIREIHAKLERQHFGDETIAQEENDTSASTAQENANPNSENNASMESSGPEALRQRLTNLNGELATLQGELPLMQVCVDGQAVAEVVSEWTGIPVGRMMADEINSVLNLKLEMGKRVVGQPHALEAIAQNIRTARAQLTDPRRPIGVFLFAGPSGVGKTETAITLAELLYGGSQNMTVINMSEFKEEHKVSLLMGSPPGYVGYGEGGVLTEAVRRKPYSVVLLDEMEKAHPGVQDVFYQVFDKGMLRDGEGRDIDFRNTIIIMTSNAASDLVMKLCADEETAPEPEALADALRPELLKTFKPAFLGRVSVVPYYPLGDAVLQEIVKLQLNKIGERIAHNYGAQFEYNNMLPEQIAARCKDVESGARNIDHILTRTMLPELAARFLGRMAGSEAIGKVTVSLDDSSNFTYQIS